MRDVEIDAPSPESSSESHIVISRLASAVVSTAPGAGQWLFVGWGEDDRPAYTDRVAALSKSAHRAFVIYRESGLWPRQLRFRRLDPMEYALTGPALDFADAGQGRAQDQIQYVLLDSAGDRKEVSVGELAVLEAIVSAREPWQQVTEASGADYARSALPLYTVFVPHPEGEADRGLAILFRPTIPEEGNEAAFRTFVRHSLGRLLVLDESQGRKARKGYLDAAADFAGLPSRGGPAALLGWLRGLGAVEFDDRWLERRLGMLRARLLKGLRALGAISISDEMLEEMMHPRPAYDLDQLDIKGLANLAEAMYWAAREALS